jgi:hypothetical protein
MTRLEELEALAEENSTPELSGRIAAAMGKGSYDNPYWEFGIPAAFQSCKAMEWRDGLEREYEEQARRARGTTHEAA